jgi:hypothetical protein
MTLRRRETEYRTVTFSVKANELSFFDRLEKITEYPGFGTEEKSAVSKYFIFTVYMSAFVLRARNSNRLKVPKHENFSLAFFALSEPIWVCDLGTGPKNPFFII